MPEHLQQKAPANSDGSANSVVTPCLPPHIPDHELLRCIGQGSYGEVWLARNVVGTFRAVKVVRRATFERAEQQRHSRLPVSDCVSIGVTLASALAHLHKHGLVHRDVKPSNIIFVGGVPKLADIGLVADASEARSFVGTVGFIPPEGPGSPQADLYSLGKVLYEISTGQDRQDFPQLPPDLLGGERTRNSLSWGRGPG